MLQPAYDTDSPRASLRFGGAVARLTAQWYHHPESTTNAEGGLPLESLQELTHRLREFVAERAWDQFHSPKNLAMALAVEVAEILEHFQWLTEQGSSKLPDEKLSEIREEIGDVLIYLVRLADVLGIDPLKAAEDKLAKNEGKYPAEKVKGKALKYTEYSR